MGYKHHDSEIDELKSKVKRASAIRDDAMADQYRFRASTLDNMRNDWSHDSAMSHVLDQYSDDTLRAAIGFDGLCEQSIDDMNSDIKHMRDMRDDK
jgi:hypothetical protein